MLGKPILLLDFMKYFKFRFDYKFLKLFQGIIPLTKYMHFAFTF